MDEDLAGFPRAWLQIPESGFKHRAQIFDFALEPPKPKWNKFAPQAGMQWRRAGYPLLRICFTEVTFFSFWKNPTEPGSFFK